MNLVSSTLAGLLLAGLLAGGSAVADARPQQKTVEKPVAERPSTEPRLARYQILVYSSPTNPIRLGQIELVAGGTYRFYAPGGRLLGTGCYAFDPEKRAIVWRDGLLKEQGWTGTFSVERAGKTHKIELKRGTIATNSID